MNRVHRAEQLVAELESMPHEGWRRLERRANFWLYMEEYWRAKCLVDFWWFLQYVGYHGQMKHYAAAVHGPAGMSGWLQSWQRTVCPRCGAKIPWPATRCQPCDLAVDAARAIVEPVKWKLLATTRDGCKTQFLSAYNGWEFARDVNLCLRVCAFTQPLANQVGYTIMRILENARYRRAFPWVNRDTKDNGQPSLWSPAALMLKREEDAQRTPSMMATGIEASITGNHFHRARYSDIETEDNCNSAEQLAGAIERMENDTSLYVGGAQKVIEGTTWSLVGPINGIIEGHEKFRPWDVDIFYMSAETECFPSEFVCTDSVSLDDDRVTLRTRAALFPSDDTSLKLCRVTVSFFLVEAGQVVSQQREAVENGADWVRVNRPFPSAFGQPQGFVVGNTKPSMPHRHTHDAIDDVPPVELQDSVLTRNSLVQQKASLGPSKYSGQYLLKPVDESTLILNPAKARVITLEQVPKEGERHYFRGGDFATESKTKAASAMAIGFWHRTGLYFVRSFYKPQASPLELLLELFVGQLWVASQQWGAEAPQSGWLRFTELEEAMVEKSTLSLYDQALQDPHKFFSGLGGHFAEAADFWFKNEEKSIGAVNVPFRRVTRTTDKCARVAAFQAPLENEQVYFVKDTFAHVDEALSFMQQFRLNSKTGLDLLEALQSVNEQRPVFQAAREEQKGTELQRVLQDARLRSILQRAGVRGSQFMPTRGIR